VKKRHAALWLFLSSLVTRHCFIEVNMEMLSTVTKMQQLDAKNPGFLAILDGHLDKRKRPSWIADKLSSRYRVAGTQEDNVDYIGQKWAPKVAPTAVAAGGKQEPTVGPDSARPVIVEAQAETGIGLVGPDGIRPVIAEAQAGTGTGNQELELATEASLPVSHLPSTVYPSQAEAPQLESPVLMESRVPKAKPPKRASITPRKRRAALLESQVALVEKCLMEGASGIDSLGR